MQKAYAPSGKNHLLEKVALWLIKLVEDHTKDEPLFTLKSTITNRNRNTEESIDEIITALESAGWLRKAHRTRKDDSHYYEVNLKIRYFAKRK
jgi:tRNA G26 N,N-dimethylase Trm1